MADDDRIGGRRAPRTTTGRVPFVWVEDDSTGHRYDVPETALRAGMTPVEGVEKNYGRRARPAKHRTDLAGNDATGPRAAQPQTTVTAGDTSGAEQAKADSSPKGARK